MKQRAFGLLLILTALAVNCNGDDEAKVRAWLGRSLFVKGCPRSGVASAQLIENPRLGMKGPDALGTVGDYLLMNERAAFIIQGVTHVNTYNYYGGTPIDAVALSGCAQAGPEQFEEMGLVMGTLNMADPLSSSLRGFHGEEVEIVNDGSDGRAAIVRVRGVDDYYWLVELTLIKEVYLVARDLGLDLWKPLSGLLGLDIYVDYILEPDSPVLRIEVNFDNLDPIAKDILGGMTIFFGNATNLKYYFEASDSLIGYGFDTGAPFLASSSGEGAWVLGMENAYMGTANIHGVWGIFDKNQLDTPLALAADGQPGDVIKVVYFFGVGGSDFNSGLAGLHAENPHPLLGWNVALTPFEGRAFDNLTGDPVAGADVELQIQNPSGDWRFIDGFKTDEQGRFGGLIPYFDRDYRLVASIVGRPNPAAQVFRPVAGLSMEVGFDQEGYVSWSVSDQDGKSLPAKLILWNGGWAAYSFYEAEGEAPVVPGHYEVSVTRGTEYTSFQGAVDVIAGQTVAIVAVLEHVVDTSGYLSMDGHIHAGPSGDNMIPIPDRIRTAAAEGLEVAIGTDHEKILPWDFGVRETGLARFVSTVTGQEVTATVPEHTNIYPVVPDFSENLLGGFVRWFGLDLAEIWAAEADRGAQVRQLNHPRAGCNYLCLIEYNRQTGLAELDNPEKIGLPADAQLVSMDFEAIEIMNGVQDPFLSPGNPDETGTFDDWMSFLNFGYHITAVGNSDAHDYDTPGYPRNYFPSRTDAPLQFRESDLVDAVQQGRVVVSAGAFARVEINGQAQLGDLIADTDGAVDLHVRIEALPEIDVTSFIVLVNCDQVAVVNTTAPNAVVKYDGTISIPIGRDAHVVVVGFGKNYLPRGLPQFNPSRRPRFIANPIYVDFDGNGLFNPPSGKTCAYILP